VGPDLGENHSSPFSRFTAAFSLIGDTSGGAVVNSGGPNILNQGPLLGVLQDNGGPTPTRLLPANSPALDQGVPFGHTTDQRGLARTGDNAAIANAAGGDGTDIGAVEIQVAGGPSDGPGPAPLSVRGCLDETATIVGTTGNDVITGTEGRDVIRGLRGNDVIKSLGGDDIVCGDKGVDKIRTGEGDDNARGGNSGDRIRGGDGDDTLRGGSGFDSIRGEAGDDQLFGGAPRGKTATGPGGPGGPGNVCDGGDGTDSADGCETVSGVP
jgi:Ca2+-binding RTX toxin-like protein